MTDNPDVITYKEATRLVDEYLPITDGKWFETKEAYAYCNAYAVESKHNVSMALLNYRKHGKLDGSRGRYRVVNKAVELLEWHKADPTDILDITWPFSDMDNSHFGFDDNLTLYPKTLAVVAGVSNMGKALANGTPILTPNGWKPIDSLCIGDTVFCIDGTLTMVTGVFPQGLHPLYRFSLNDGSYIDSSKSHIWRVKMGYNRSHRKTGHGNSNINFGTYDLKTTEDIVKHCGMGIIKASSHHRPELPPIGPVEFCAQPVPLDPYLLGVLLGDGHFTKTSIQLSTADSFLLDGFDEYDIERISKYDYRINGLVPTIRDLGLGQLHSYEKFIPPEYLFNDVFIRLSMLQGLMDADGSVDKMGEIKYSSTSRQLAEGVQFLVRSLGGRARLRYHTNSYKYNGHTILARDKYRVYIKINQPIFRLERKAIRQKKYKKTSNRIIKSISYAGIQECTCIKVAHPSGMFIAKDFIPTHNTAFMLNLIVKNMDKWCVEGKGIRYLTNEMGAEEFAGRIDRYDKYGYDVLDDDGEPRFEVVERYENYQDVMLSDGLNIIDYLDPGTDPYKIGHIFDAILQSLNRGCAFIAIQKKMTTVQMKDGTTRNIISDYGTGGQYSEHRPRIVLHMESDHLYVKKAKMCRKWNLTGKRFMYEIDDGGSQFRNITGVTEESIGPYGEYMRDKGEG